MFLFSKRQNDRHAVLRSRADYITQKLRVNLPPSSLWQEKRFAKSQLESIVIVSTGGLYAVNNFDISIPDFKARPEILLFADLGMSVQHSPGSHNALSQKRIEQLIHEANAEFEQLLATDRQSTTSMARRITATIEFSVPQGNIEEIGHESFTEISRRLGLKLSYVPYITQECWLPDSHFHNATFSTEDGRSAAEFVLPNLHSFKEIEFRIHEAFSSSGTIRAPGMHSSFSIRDRTVGIHFVARSF